MNPSPTLQAYRTYQESIENFRRFECNMLRLMRHPETTVEQAEQVRVAYVDMFKRMSDAYELLTTKMGRRAARPSLTAYHDWEAE